MAAPTRQVNSVIAPGGYLGTWCRANGRESTVEALYQSAYNEVVVFGLFSQLISGEAQSPGDATPSDRVQVHELHIVCSFLGPTTRRGAP
jgi:hypothetical protein